MKQLVNPNLHDLSPYKPGKPIEEIQRTYNLDKVVKLASNENPFPIPGHVANAIRDELGSLHFYPDSDSYYLKEKIASYLNVRSENLILSPGSSEVIKMIVRAFLKPGETVLTSDKTFLMYRIASIEACGKESFAQVEITDEYCYDLDGFRSKMDENTKIIFIANPNNPTGTMLPKDELMKFIDEVPEDKLVVLDNAYQEYVLDEARYLDGIELAVNRKNVIVLRTFSKIYALAGLRVGYAIANKDLIFYLGKVKSPFNISRVAQRAAIASLESDDFKKKSADLNAKNREVLFAKLQDMGLSPIPSQANFILFFPETDIGRLNDSLLREGVIIRPLQPFGFDNAMRVTVGIEADNEYFLNKLGKVLAERN